MTISRLVTLLMLFTVCSAGTQDPLGMMRDQVHGILDNLNISLSFWSTRNSGLIVDKAVIGFATTYMQTFRRDKLQSFENSTDSDVKAFVNAWLAGINRTNKTIASSSPISVMKYAQAIRDIIDGSHNELESMIKPSPESANTSTTQRKEVVTLFEVFVEDIVWQFNLVQGKELLRAYVGNVSLILDNIIAKNNGSIVGNAVTRSIQSLLTRFPLDAINGFVPANYTKAFAPTDVNTFVAARVISMDQLKKTLDEGKAISINQLAKMLREIIESCKNAFNVVLDSLQTSQTDSDPNLARWPALQWFIYILHTCVKGLSNEEATAYASLPPEAKLSPLADYLGPSY